jgi:hypothetical protein
MRALRGIIVKVRKKFTKVELESGNTVTVKTVAHLKRGDKVQVCYDFTHNRVRDIWIAESNPDVLDENLTERTEEDASSFPSENVGDDANEETNYQELSFPDMESWEWELEEVEDEGAFSFPESEGQAFD